MDARRVLTSAALATLTIICTVCPSKAAVDEGLAKRWIGRGFSPGACTPASAPYDISSRQPDSAEVKKAWQALKQCRDSGAAKTQDIVAAENYLFIRFVAGQTGDTGYKPFSQLYYLAKLAGSKAGFLQKFRSNPTNPVSDPDPAVRDWGDRGYRDGIADYEKRTGQPASLKTSALDTAAQFFADLAYGN